MKKLATKTRGWADSLGNLHRTQKAAIQATADLKLADLLRRLSAAIPGMPQRHSDHLRATATGIPLGVRTAEGAIFLTAASWFKENPELVRLLGSYDAAAKEVPKDLADYKATRIKHGAVYESYEQWKTRTKKPSYPVPVAKATPEPLKVETVINDVKVFVPQYTHRKWKREMPDKTFWYWLKNSFPNTSGEDQLSYYERLMRGSGVILPGQSKVQDVPYIAISVEEAEYTDYFSSKANTTKFRQASGANSLGEDARSVKSVLGNIDKSDSKYPA